MIMPLWIRRLVCRVRGHQTADIVVAIICCRCDFYIPKPMMRAITLPKSAELSTVEKRVEAMKIRISNPWGRA